MKCCKIFVLYRELKYDKISWNILIKVVYLQGILQFSSNLILYIYTEAIYMAQYQNVESRCFLTTRLLHGYRLTLFL